MARIRLLPAFTLLAAMVFAPASPALAAWSAEGLWMTIDDDTDEPKSIVKISKGADGKLVGHIVEVLDPEAPKLCDKCRGDLKNKPLVGMRIMWDLEPDDDNEWDDGNIMDPGNGKTYDCKIEVVEGGAKLRVRGYIGLSFIGRTQVWVKRPADRTQTR